MTISELGALTRVNAPATYFYPRPPALLSVAVEEGEDVKWIWTHFADGRSVVTGYRIVSKNLLSGDVRSSTTGR
jgi:hypothetical protein